MSTLAAGDFVNWLNEQKVVFASQRGNVNKDLGYSLRGFIFVAHNGRIVLTTTSPDKAVDLYNRIDENTVFEG